MVSSEGSSSVLALCVDASVRGAPVGVSVADEPVDGFKVVVDQGLRSVPVNCPLHFSSLPMFVVALLSLR